jgi:hypothetical protein
MKELTAKQEKICRKKLGGKEEFFRLSERVFIKREREDEA